MNAAALVYRTAAQAFVPDPELTVSEWADEHRMLTTLESPEAGRWRTSRVPYLREVMDTLSASSPVQRVVLMKGAQLGATEAGLNWIGYAISHVPGPMLCVQPTVEMAERVSRQRLTPLIQHSPAVRRRVPPNRSRDGGASLHAKTFPGGILLLTGANSAAGLRSMPIRYLFADEVDGWPEDVDGEGDPLALAEQRTQNFRRRKVFICSTPTVKGLSRIEREYEDSDQRQYWVPCQDCGEFQVLEWAQVHWDEGRPETAVYVCQHCGCEWDGVQRIRSVKYGQWRAQLPFRGTAGFHISSLYSSWVRLPELAAEFLKKKKDPTQLQSFINMKLAQTWEERGVGIDSTGLLVRRETYSANPLPQGVVLITAGVDVQDDRLEAEVVGWGVGEESWSLEYLVLRGDPTGGEVWRELDAVLLRRYQHPWGEQLPIAAACIDSGHHTQSVYRFVRDRYARKVWAVKGYAGSGRPIMAKPSRRNAQKVALFPVGVDTAKTKLYARLQVADPGAGYCHFPDSYDEAYFRQLTAEKMVTQYHKGFARRVWVKRSSERNEALDCRVYAMAALEGLVVRLEDLAATLLARKQARERPRQEQSAPPPQRQGSSWATGGALPGGRSKWGL